MRLKFYNYKECVIFLLLTALSIYALFTFVDLSPKVDQNFFFSSKDPRFQQEKQIAQLFDRKDTLIIIAAEGDINNKDYTQNLRRLSDDIVRLTGVAAVRSITHGPKSIKDALNSPLWKRLLISPNLRSTNIVVIIEKIYPTSLVENIEHLVNKYQSNNFKLYISGAPYIVELIQKNLAKDLRRFSLIVYAVFGLMIFLIFRSASILLGSLIACTNACILTLISCKLLDIPIGLLTANLVTIVFILTLEPIVFITYNWKHMCKVSGPGSCVDNAVRFTFSASFWSMFTTLLGFLSLLAVPAKPLRELGLSGSIGSLIGIFSAYSIYPSFLKLVDARLNKTSGIIEEKEHSLYLFLEKSKKYIIWGILIGCVALSTYIVKVNTDPSLLSYFKKGSKIIKGLQYIDRSDGSNPLTIVVESQSGEKLDSAKAYKQLWNLQDALEEQGSVGVAISLPVLLAEVKRIPFSFLLSWKSLFGIIENPSFGQIAKNFITKDHKQALFLLLMKEEGRKKTRLSVIEELNKVVQAKQFKIKIAGGVYALQGHLSNLVASSLIFGLSRLILIFFFISWVVARSFRIASAMILNLCLMPLGIIGLIGLMGLPLDIISAPASNLAISMGIDSMFYMVKQYKAIRLTSGDEKMKWSQVQKRLWQPILTLMFILIIGFSIFLFSQFPPTQRFGFAIISGSIVAALASLFVMPELAKISYSFSHNKK